MRWPKLHFFFARRTHTHARQKEKRETVFLAHSKRTRWILFLPPLPPIRQTDVNIKVRREKKSVFFSFFLLEAEASSIEHSYTDMRRLEMGKERERERRREREEREREGEREEREREGGGKKGIFSPTIRYREVEEGVKLLFPQRRRWWLRQAPKKQCVGFFCGLSSFLLPARTDSRK